MRDGKLPSKKAGAGNLPYDDTEAVVLQSNSAARAQSRRRLVKRLPVAVPATGNLDKTRESRFVRLIRRMSINKTGA